MAKAILQIGELNCAGCAKKIENHLTALNGMESVNVFPQLGKVRMLFDDTTVSLEKIEKVLNSLGYPVHSSKTA